MSGVSRWATLMALVLGMCLGAPASAEDEPGTYAGKDARWWVGQLADREGAQAARVAFKKIGRPALEPLADALDADDRSVRYAASRALGK